MDSVSNSRAGRLPRSWIAVALILFSAVLLVERLRFYNAPLHSDICAYAMIGHETLHGRELYSDLWERKPPLLYATFAGAELVVGYGRAEIFVVGLAAALATLLCLYSAGKSLGGPTAGLVTALFWALVNFDMGLTGNQPDPEVFINAFTAAALAVMLRSEKQTNRSAAAIGLLLGLATLYKHNAVLLAGALLLSSLLVLRTTPLSNRLRQFAISSGVIAGLWFGLIGYFAARGRLAPLIDVLFRQNAAYSGNSFFGNLLRSLQFDRLFPDFLTSLAWPAAAFVLILAIALFRRADRQIARGYLFFAIYAVGIWATVAVTGYLYAHYYQLWIPFWCLLGGNALGRLLMDNSRLPKTFRYGVAGVILAGSGYTELSQFQFSPEQWVKKQFPYFDVPQQNAVGIYLGQLLKPTESFYELGEDNSLYFLSKHSPPSGLLFIDPLLYGTDTAGHWKKLMGELQSKKPDLIIMSDAWLKFFPTDAPIFSWLPATYVPAMDPNLPPAYHLFARRGSALATDSRLVKARVSP